MHTPGPWHVGQGNGCGSVFAESGRMRPESGGTTLYPICSTTRGWEASEDAANARVLAAAPELLEACEWALSQIEEVLTDEMFPVTRAKLRAAIATATGAQQ